MLNSPTVKYIKGTKNLKNVNRIEDIKLVSKITDWNPMGVRTKGRPKNRRSNKWSEEAKNEKLQSARQQ
jgi:hypothetical protein